MIYYRRLTHSLHSISNRSTSASLTLNLSRRPWRALRRPPARNRCHKSSHPVPLLLTPKLLQLIRQRLQRIRRRWSAHSCTYWHDDARCHVGLPRSQGSGQGGARRLLVGQLGGVTTVDLLGGAVPWVPWVRVPRACAAKQCPTRPLARPEGPLPVTWPMPLPRSVLLDIVGLHQR
jgi:hypothetical protein